MSDLLALLKALHRPRLLVRAARLGVADYNRARDLKRLMRAATVPGPERALARLIAEEAELEAERQAGDARYSLIRHLDLLIAMIGEARLLPRPEA